MYSTMGWTMIGRISYMCQVANHIGNGKQRKVVKGMIYYETDHKMARCRLYPSLKYYSRSVSSIAKCSCWMAVLPRPDMSEIKSIVSIRSNAGRSTITHQSFQRGPKCCRNPHRVATWTMKVKMHT